MAFSASLVRLVTEPARYGWEGDGTIEVPAEERVPNAERIAADPAVEAATLVNSEQGVVGGAAHHRVRPRAAARLAGVHDPVGRPPAAPDETVLGPRLADELGVGVGDAVQLGVGLRRDGRG